MLNLDQHRSLLVAPVMFMALLTACTFSSGGVEVSDLGLHPDRGVDGADLAPPEGGPETGVDLGDAGADLQDSGVDLADVGAEGGTDVGADVGLDLGSDAAADAAPDAQADVGVDLSPDLGPDQSTTPVLPPLVSGQGRIVVGSGSASDPSLVYTFKGASTALTLEPARPVVVDPYWVLHRVVGGSDTLVFKHRQGGKAKLNVLRWDGTSWAQGPQRTESNQNHITKRDIALAVESSSGDALLVYGARQQIPLYATFSNGVWSALAPISATLTTPNSVAIWTELAASPSSDEVVLVVADVNRRLWTIRWDGGAWDTASAQVIATNVKRNPDTNTLSNRPFDVAFEQQSGDVLVVWGRENQNGIGYRRREAGSWQSGQALASALAGGEVHYVDLAADPSSDRVAGGFFDLGDGTERLGLGTWSGSAWVGAQEVDSQIRDINDRALGDFPGAVTWLGNTGRAICLVSDDSPRLSWWEWSSAQTAWQSRGGIALPNGRPVESVQVRGGGVGEALGVVTDNQSRIHGIYFDGTSWSVLNPSPLPPTVSRVNSRPFAVAFP